MLKNLPKLTMYKIDLLMFHSIPTPTLSGVFPISVNDNCIPPVFQVKNIDAI